MPSSTARKNLENSNTRFLPGDLVTAKIRHYLTIRVNNNLNGLGIVISSSLKQEGTVRIFWTVYPSGFLSLSTTESQFSETWSELNLLKLC